MPAWRLGGLQHGLLMAACAHQGPASFLGNVTWPVLAPGLAALLHQRTLWAKPPPHPPFLVPGRAGAAAPTQAAGQSMSPLGFGSGFPHRRLGPSCLRAPSGRCRLVAFALGREPRVHSPVCGLEGQGTVRLGQLGRARWGMRPAGVQGWRGACGARPIQGTVCM